MPIILHSIVFKQRLHCICYLSQIFAPTTVFHVLKGVCYIVTVSGSFFYVSDSCLAVTSLVCCISSIALGLDYPIVFLHMTGWNTAEHIGIKTSPSTGQPMNRGLICGRSKKFVCPPNTSRLALKRTQLRI